MIPRLRPLRIAAALAVVLGIAIGMLVISGLEAQQVTPDTKPEDLAEGEFVWEPEAALASRVHIPPFFVSQIYDSLVPGTTLIITNRPATPEIKSDSDFVIMATHPPEEGSE